MNISVYSRIHITLISMTNNHYRHNGGIGFALNNPNINISFSPSKTTKINKKTDSNLQITELTEFISSLKKKLNFSTSIEINISDNVLSHHGFGTGTAIKLACIEALFKINQIEYTDKILVDLCGRGGTSGIGIHSFFSGGFIYDLGHKNVSEQEMMPSHSFKSPSTPLLLSREEMPNWSIGICIPKDIKPLNHKEERDFFKATCPISEVAVFEACYHSLFGVLGAIKTKDYDAFCLSIKNIQECEWKKKERQLHGKRLQHYEEKLYLAGADAVGMSSLGPTLFFMAEDIDKVIASFDESTCQLVSTKAINNGRVFSNV